MAHRLDINLTINEDLQGCANYGAVQAALANKETIADYEARVSLLASPLAISTKAAECMDTSSADVVLPHPNNMTTDFMLGTNGRIMCSDGQTPVLSINPSTGVMEFAPHAWINTASNPYPTKLYVDGPSRSNKPTQTFIVAPFVNGRDTVAPMPVLEIDPAQSSGAIPILGLPGLDSVNLGVTPVSHPLGTGGTLFKNESTTATKMFSVHIQLQAPLQGAVRYLYLVHESDRANASPGSHVSLSDIGTIPHLSSYDVDDRSNVFVLQTVKHFFVRLSPGDGFFFYFLMPGGTTTFGGTSDQYCDKNVIWVTELC